MSIYKYICIYTRIYVQLYEFFLPDLEKANDNDIIQ